MSKIELDEWQTLYLDPNQMPHVVASDMGLHSLLRPSVPIFRVIMV